MTTTEGVTAMTEKQETSELVVHISEPSPPRTLHPCEIGKHRWAWLVDGRQACGYCGRPR